MPPFPHLIPGIIPEIKGPVDTTSQESVLDEAARSVIDAEELGTCSSPAPEGTIVPEFFLPVRDWEYTDSLAQKAGIKFSLRGKLEYWKTV